MHTFRAPSQRGEEDEALGSLKDCDLKVHVLSYSGKGVTTKIGTAFIAIAVDSGIDPEDCRVAAKTRNSGLKAIGAYTDDVGQSLSLRLANAVMKFHNAKNPKDQLSAITEVHLITMGYQKN